MSIKEGVKCSFPVDMLLIFRFRWWTLLLSRANGYCAKYEKGNENISSRWWALQSHIYMLHHADNSVMNIEPTHTRKNKSIVWPHTKLFLEFIAGSWHFSSSNGTNSTPPIQNRAINWALATIAQICLYLDLVSKD